MRTQKPSAACNYRTQIRFLPNNKSGNKPLLSSKKPSAGTDPRVLILSSHCPRRKAALGRAIKAESRLREPLHQDSQKIAGVLRAGFSRPGRLNRVHKLTTCPRATLNF